MATKEVGWAPANVWFKPGFDYLQEVDVDGQKIRILPLPYYLATKFSAYKDRGKNDPRTSHDFEDIIYILDNRTDLVEEIRKAPVDVKKYLCGEFKKIIEGNTLRETIYGNLFYETRDKRFEYIMEKLKAILKEKE